MAENVINHIIPLYAVKMVNLNLLLFVFCRGLFYPAFLTTISISFKDCGPLS